MNSTNAVLVAVRTISHSCATRSLVAGLGVINTVSANHCTIGVIIGATIDLTQPFTRSPIQFPPLSVGASTGGSAGAAGVGLTLEVGVACGPADGKCVGAAPVGAGFGA